jgi:predicted DNA-binding protein
MANDWHLMQIRVGQRLRNRIRRLSKQHDNTCADIVRGSLELGVQIMEKLLEAREIMAKEYLHLLKTQSRKKNNYRGKNIETTTATIKDATGDSDIEAL